VKSKPRVFLERRRKSVSLTASLPRLLLRNHRFQSVAFHFKTNTFYEWADAPDLGSGGEILRGSSPLPGTHRKSKRSTLNLQLSTPNSDAVSWTLGVERSTFKSRVIAQATSVRGNVSWFPIDGFRLETHSHFARVPFLPASDSNGARDRHQERRNRQ